MSSIICNTCACQSTGWLSIYECDSHSLELFASKYPITHPSLIIAYPYFLCGFYWAIRRISKAFLLLRFYRISNMPDHTAAAHQVYYKRLDPMLNVHSDISLSTLQFLHGKKCEIWPLSWSYSSLSRPLFEMQQNIKPTSNAVSLSSQHLMQLGPIHSKPPPSSPAPPPPAGKNRTEIIWYISITQLQIVELRWN